MNAPKGTRGGAGTSTGLSVGEDRWPPDMHVHVRSVPAYLVWMSACGLAAALFLLAFIAFQDRANGKAVERIASDLNLWRQVYAADQGTHRRVDEGAAPGVHGPR